MNSSCSRFCDGRVLQLLLWLLCQILQSGVTAHRVWFSCNGLFPLSDGSLDPFRVSRMCVVGKTEDGEGLSSGYLGRLLLRNVRRIATDRVSSGVVSVCVIGPSPGPGGDQSSRGDRDEYDANISSHGTNWTAATCCRH